MDRSLRAAHRGDEQFHHPRDPQGDTAARCYLLCRRVAGPGTVSGGDTVLLEAPSYLGAIQAWQPYEPRFATVPINEDGMQVNLVGEMLFQKRPKFVYALPNFQNPAGTTLPLERRERLVELANDYGVPIVEDDPYGELRFSGDHIPPMVVLDAHRLIAQGENDGGRYHRGDVIYLSTFSKTLAPGLRLGWVVALRPKPGRNATYGSTIENGEDSYGHLEG